MFQQERIKLSGLAVEQVSCLFGTKPGPFYLESMQEKLNLLLQAVDKAAHAVNGPVLFPEIIPGFDLVILRNPDQALNPEGGVDQFDAKALSAVDESCLQMLAQAVEKHMGERELSGEDQLGAYIFKGSDGLHYFGFRTRDRATILGEMGVADDGIIKFGSEVLQ